MGDVRKLQEEIFDDFTNKKIKFLAKKSKIRFHCQRSGQCCHHNQVMLNPFDIMEMARFLAMPSSAFLQQYVSFHIGADSHLPIAMLEQIQDGDCAFLKDRRCSIHPAKPKICRAFPLVAASVFDQKTGKAQYGYLQTERVSCPGTRANHTVTFEQFRKQSGLKRYDEGSRPFVEGVQELCANYRTGDLTETDYQFIIPLLYCPDSVLKRKDGDQPADSGDWTRIGMKLVIEYLKSRGLHK